MKIYVKPAELRRVLRDLAPHRVAVAYVGGDWVQYIDAKKLNEIVLSPTLGSNPRAIEEIIDSLGISNVHFLDQLHSKIYLGMERAVLGSPNLSSNGFSDAGKHEAIVLLDETEALETLNVLFEEYLVMAAAMYPTEQRKLEKLAELKMLARRARRNGVDVDVLPSKNRPLTSYTIGRDKIHIAWYGSSVADYNEPVVRKAIGNKVDVSLEKYFHDSMQFLNRDSIKEGDWILCWRCTEEGMARKNGKVSWMHVDCVIRDGFDDEHYPKLAGQLSPHDPAEEPFEIDENVRNIVIEALNSKKFESLLAIKEPWSLNDAANEVDSFLKNIQRVAQQLAAGRRP